MLKTTPGARGFREYFWGGVAILSILVVGAFLLAQSRTDRLREQATLALRKPEALERYDQLSIRKQPKPIDEKEPESVEGKSLGAQPVDFKEWGSEDNLARWEHLLTRWERFRADKSQDGWQAVASALEKVDARENVPRHRKLPGELSPEEWTRIEACMSREQDLVREILEVAELGGPVRALDFTGGPSLGFSHYPPLRQMCSFLVWDAIVKARAGDMPAAAESLVGGMRLGAALLGEPMLDSQYVRMSICREVEWALREAFEAGQLPPGELRRILDELGKAKVRGEIADAIRGEAFLKVREFAALRGGKREAYGFASLSNHPYSFNTLPSKLLLRVYAGPLGAPWFNADEAALATTMERIAAAAERPYYRVQSELASIDEQLASTSFTHVFSRRMFEDYQAPLEAQAGFEASLDLTRIGLLVEEYGVLRGAYPRSLDEIAADLGGTVPVDPFSGKGYRYVVVGEGFLLYSVGKNLRDDGGTPDWEKGDIVWRGER